MRILVTEAPPFVIAHNTSAQAQFEKKNPKPTYFLSDPLKTKHSDIVIYGFIADLIRELQMQMHFNYTIDIANQITDYHALVASMAEKNRKYDLIVSDIRITSNRLLKVDFSTPFCENTFGVIIRKNPYSSSFSLLSFLKPFTWQVWIITLAAILYSSLIIYLFEREHIEIGNHQFGINSLLTGMCRVLAYLIMVSADIRLTTNASRLIMVGLYALGTILLATYTANLSSFLTLNRVQPSISGIDDIKNGRFPFSRIGIVTNSAASDYYIQNISSKYYSLSTVEEIYSRLLDYTIDAAIWDSYILEYATNNYYCDQLSVVGVGFLKSSYGIVLSNDWPYKKDLDVHIMAMRESEKLELFESRWLESQTCSSSSSSSSNRVGQTRDSNIEIFSVDSVGGLFLIFFILTVIAIIFNLWDRRVDIKNIFCQTMSRIKLYIIRLGNDSFRFFMDLNSIFFH